MPMETKRVHLLISGEVTGVGFRLSTIYIARDLGLAGWVRNVENPSTGSGQVEILAEGTKEKLDNLVTWAQQGPPLAKVETIEVKWSKAIGEFKEFTVKY